MKKVNVCGEPLSNWYIYNATLNAPRAQNIVEEWTERWRQETEDQATSCVIVSSRPDRGTTPQAMHNDCCVWASRMPLHGLKNPIPIPPSFQTPSTQRVSKQRKNAQKPRSAFLTAVTASSPEVATQVPAHELSFWPYLGTAPAGGGCANKPSPVADNL